MNKINSHEIPVIKPSLRAVRRQFPLLIAGEVPVLRIGGHRKFSPDQNHHDHRSLMAIVLAESGVFEIGLPLSEPTFEPFMPDTGFHADVLTPKGSPTLLRAHTSTKDVMGTFVRGISDGLYPETRLEQLLEKGQFDPEHTSSEFFEGVIPAGDTTFFPKSGGLQTLHRYLSLEPDRGYYWTDIGLVPTSQDIQASAVLVQ